MTRFSLGPASLFDRLGSSPCLSAATHLIRDDAHKAMLAVTKFNLVPVMLVLLALALVPVPLLPPHLLAERAGRALGFGGKRPIS
jgi:hypothetical protein